MTGHDQDSKGHVSEITQRTKTSPIYRHKCCRGQKGIAKKERALVSKVDRRRSQERKFGPIPKGWALHLLMPMLTTSKARPQAGTQNPIQHISKGYDQQILRRKNIVPVIGSLYLPLPCPFIDARRTWHIIRQIVMPCFVEEPINAAEELDSARLSRADIFRVVEPHRWRLLARAESGEWQRAH